MVNRYSTLGLWVLFLLLWSVFADLELQPLRPGDWSGHKLVRRDPSLFELQNYETFLWDAPGGQDGLLGNFTVYTPGDFEHILSMEKFGPMLKSIKCTPTLLTLTFDDDDTFAYAKAVWDWVNGADDHSFLMVAGAGDCGDNTDRTPYMVHTLRYDEISNTAYLSVTTGAWEDFVHAYELRVGKVSEPAHRRLRRDKNDKTAMSFEKPFPFKVKVEVGSILGELECEDCYFGGGLDVDMHIAFGIPDIIDKAVFRMQPKAIQVRAKTKLTVGSKAGQKTVWKRSLLPEPVPLYGITLAGFMRLGLFTDFLLGLEATAFEGTFSVVTGAKAAIPDSAFVEVDFKDLGDIDSSSWAPTVDPYPFEVSGKATTKLQLFIAPELKLEASALKFGYEAELELKMPYFDAELTLESNDAGGVCEKPDYITALYMKGTLGAELKFEAGKLDDKTPFEWTIGTIPILETPPLCLPLDKKGSKPKSSSKPATPSKGSTPSKSSTIPKSTPTCMAGGMAGTCISTEKCKNLGGNSEAGHCPGAKNIQCCTYKEGTGDTCTANGVPGTCMPTASCPDDTGLSVAGHCRGPTDIQCCISKEKEKQATAKNTCEITKAGLKTSGFVGECISKTNCQRLKGTSTPGFCPGTGAEIQCCTYGACKGKAGVCEPVSTCTGTTASGYCGGGNNIKCCSQNFNSDHPGIEKRDTLLGAQFGGMP